MNQHGKAPATSHPILVEQLSHSQWHIVHGPFTSGVSDYVSSVADALGWAAIYRRPVETVALNGTRLLMSRAPVRLRGAPWVR
jgi:hypothetical protein